MRVCLFDHHDYIIPTEGIGGVIGTFQMLYEGLRNENIDLTLIVNDFSTLNSEQNFNVIKLPYEKIQDLRWGKLKVADFFNKGIFYSNSSGRHVNFNFENFDGTWVSTCHGCYEFVGGSDCQVFVSNNQLSQHFRDNLFDTYSNDYRVIHNRVNPDDYYWIEGPHDKLVWMGRIDGAKAERLYEIALGCNEKIFAAGWYSKEYEWLFNKVMSTDKIEWLGEIKGCENKRKFYSMAKASIHCSSFEDPCPTTILEAQSCGIPVVTYANGSMNEICENKKIIFNNITDFLSYINHSKFEYDKNKIRQFVVENFNSKDYSKYYFNLFKTLWKK